jgi:hypothetical protein
MLRDAQPPLATGAKLACSQLDTTTSQGCQMVCFQTKNPNFGKIWTALENIVTVYGHLEYTYNCHLV